jgi:hypothetical protein
LDDCCGGYRCIKLIVLETLYDAALLRRLFLGCIH